MSMILPASAPSAAAKPAAGAGRGRAARVRRPRRPHSVVAFLPLLPLLLWATTGCGKQGERGAGDQQHHAAQDHAAGAATGEAAPDGAPPGTAPALPPAPVTFAGELPCADCPGIRTTLTLLADHSYLMRRVYREATASGDVTFIEPGRYSLEANGHTLVLQSGPQSTQRFAVASSHTLEALDADGLPIPTPANHELTHASFDPIEDAFSMHGLFTTMADAGRFRECLSGREVAVAQEGDNAALERAYTQLAAGPGQPVLVALRGHFAARPRMEGEGTQAALIVDRFETAIRAASECIPIPDAPLENTYWKVLEVNGAPMPVFDEQREAHLQLDGQGQLTGRGPCNRVTGGYARGGPDALTFTGVAATRMSCAVGMDGEAAMLAALTETRSFSIHGERLRLLAADGRPLMQLVAVYF